MMLSGLMCLLGISFRFMLRQRSFLLNCDRIYQPMVLLRLIWRRLMLPRIFDVHEPCYASMQTSFPNIETFSVAGPKWLSTSSGSVNVIFFSGSRVSEMHAPSFTTTLIEFVNQNRLPVDTLTYFHSTPPIRIDPGTILTDDYSPLDILQGQG